MRDTVILKIPYWVINYHHYLELQLAKTFLLVFIDNGNN